MSSLTPAPRIKVTEVDGSPNGFCSVLVFPNGTVSITGNTATISVSAGGATFDFGTFANPLSYSLDMGAF